MIVLCDLFYWTLFVSLHCVCSYMNTLNKVPRLIRLNILIKKKGGYHNKKNDCCLIRLATILMWEQKHLCCHAVCIHRSYVCLADSLLSSWKNKRLTQENVKAYWSISRVLFDRRFLPCWLSLELCGCWSAASASSSILSCKSGLQKVPPLQQVVNTNNSMIKQVLNDPSKT